MSKVTIYGTAGSSYVATARMACVEKGVLHDLEPVQFKAASHRALHPWLKMPAMRHDDLTLFETQAIVRYVDTAFDGPSLFPSDPKDAALAEQWISAAQSYLYPHLITNVVLGYVFPKGRDGKPDLAVIRSHVPEAEADIAILDDVLATRTWLAGTFSAADLFVGAIVGAFRRVPEGREVCQHYEHVERWIAALKGRPSGAYIA